MFRHHKCLTVLARIGSMVPSKMRKQARRRCKYPRRWVPHTIVFIVHREKPILTQGVCKSSDSLNRIMDPQMSCSLNSLKGVI